MRIVSGASDKGIEEGNSIAVVIDLKTVYPEKPTPQTPTLYTIIGFGDDGEGNKLILYTESANPIFSGEQVAKMQTKLVMQAQLVDGQMIVNTADPASFIALVQAALTS